MQKNHSSAHAGFTEIYATSNPPWDIGRPKEPFIEIADRLRVRCSMPDAARATRLYFFAARG
jgi:hypothetical protein